MEHEAAEKLVRGEAHRALPVAVGTVAPGEDDVSPSRRSDRWLEIAIRWVSRAR
jgi:hypothetical protein